MTADKETRWQSLPPFVIALLLAVGSYWWIPWPLYGERPPQSHSGVALEGVQQAEGRLWQDPFAAAQRHREHERAKPSPPSLLEYAPDAPVSGGARRDLDWLKGVAEAKCGADKRCEILGVMVFGGPYVGMEEYRRYVRYALLAGLHGHGYIPEDTEHVGYLEPARGAQELTTIPAGLRRLPPVLPFEWFRGERHDRHLLLLWLDEDALTRQYNEESSGKLLVLKALRRAFPDAVFFTTDLHAAMLHPVDNRHTRNLVVASAFGLELEPALQSGFAPFRSSYQTGSYLATRLALLDLAARAEAPILAQHRIDERIPPLVFEIGRSAPVRLDTPPPSDTDASSGCGPQREEWLECQDWQPARRNQPTGKTVAGILLAALGGLALGATVSIRIRCFLLHHWRALLGLAGLAAAFAAWLILSLPNPLGEPFSWLEGVSVWPTEILRLVTVALAIALFSSGIRTLRHGDRSIQEQFFRDRGHDGTVAGKEGPDPGASGEGGRPVPVTSIWRLYQARQLRAMIDLTKRLRKGAYSPFGEQPIVRAILGLGGGIYAIALLEWVNMAGL